jgi:hypothetical protein
MNEAGANATASECECNAMNVAMLIMLSCFVFLCGSLLVVLA